MPKKSISFLDQFNELKSKAISEITKQKDALLSQLEALNKELQALGHGESTPAKRGRKKKVQSEIAAVTGKVKKAGRKAAKKVAGKKADFSSAADLEAALESAPGKKLNRKGVNDSGHNLKSAITIAKANPKTFGFKQNGPQGEVWLK